MKTSVEAIVLANSLLENENYAAIQSIMRLHRALNKTLVRPLAQSFGLSWQEFHVIRAFVGYLSRKGGEELPMGYLVRELGWPAPQVSMQVAGLVERGLLQFVRKEGRAKYYVFTDAGYAVAVALQDRLERASERLLSEMPEADREAYARIVGSISSGIRDPLGLMSDED